MRRSMVVPAGGWPWHSHFSGTESHECFDLISSQRGVVGVARPRGMATRADSTESQYMVVWKSESETARPDGDLKTVRMARAQKTEAFIGCFRLAVVIPSGD